MKVRSVLSVGFWAAACIAFQTNPDLDNLCHDNSRNYEFRLLDSVFFTREGLWTSLRIVGTEAAAHSPTSTKEEQDPGSSNSPGEGTSGTQLPQGSTQCDWRKCGTREQVEKTIKEIEEEWGDESAFVTRKLQRRMSTPCRLKKHPCPKQRSTWEREIREEFRRVAPRHLERAATLRKALEQRPPSMSGSLGTQSTGGALPQATPEDTSVSRMSATPGNAVEVELIGFAVGNDDTDIPVFRTPGPPGTTSAPSEPQAGIPATLGGKPAILILPTTSDASTGGRSISQSGTNLTQQASFQQPGGTASGPSTSSSVSTSQTPLPPGNVRGAAGLGASTPSTTNLLQASSKNSTVDPGASSSSGVSGVAQAFPGVLPGSVMHQALQRSGLLSQPPPSERPAASKRRRKRRGGEGDLASQGVGRTGVNQPVAVDPYDNTPSPKLRFSPLRTAEGAAGATKPPHLLASLPSSDPGMFSSTGSSPTGSSRLPSPQGSSSSTSLSLGTAHRNSQTTFPLKREPLPPGTLVEPVVPLVPFAANKNGRLETVIIPSAAVVATGGSSFPQSGTDATQQVGSQQPRRTASGPPTSSFVSASQTALPPGNVTGAAGPGASTPSTTNLHQASSKNSTVDPEPSLSRSSRGVPQAFPNLQQQPQGNVVHQPLQQQPQGSVVHQPLQQQPQGSLVHQPLQQQPQGTVVHQPLQLQPQGSVVHQPLQQQTQGSLVHQPLQMQPQGNVVHQPLQQQQQQGSLVHHRPQHQPQGNVVHQPLQQQQQQGSLVHHRPQHQPQGNVVHQPLQQQPQGSVVHQPLQQQPQGSLVHHRPQHQPQGSVVHQPLQQQPQGSLVHHRPQHQPQGNVVHQPLQQQPQGSLVHHRPQHQPQGNVVHQPLQQQQQQGSLVHHRPQHQRQGNVVYQPLQQQPQGNVVHQPLQQQPQGSVVYQPLQHQPQGALVHHRPQHQAQGSVVHQPLQQQELLPPGVQPETSVSWKPALASADKGQQRSSGKMLMTLDIPGSSRRASERAYYAPSRDGALLFDQLFPEFPFEGTSMNHPQHYAGHDTANVGDSSQPKTAYSTGEVAGPASSFDFLSPTGWKRTIRSIEAPHPGHGSQQPGGGGTVLPSYPQLKDFDLTLLSTPMPAPQWDTSTNAPSENVAAKTQAVPTRGDESGSVTSPYDQLFREAAAFNESMRSDEAPKSYLTSTSMHFQSAAPSSQNRPGSLQNKPSESGRTSGVSAVGHKAAAPHVKPSDREQNPFQLFVEPLPSAPKPTSAFAWPEAGTSFEPVTSAESMTVSGGSGKKQAKRSTSPVTASLEQSPFETVSVSSATELQAPSISEYGSPRTHLSSTPAVKGPSAGPVSSTSNEFGSLLAAALREAGWSDGMTEDEATDFVLDSIKNLEELQVANEWDAASTETRPAAEGGTQHASFNLVSTLLGPDATPTPPGSRSTPPGGPTKKPSAMGRQKPSSRSTSDSKVEGRSSTRDSSLVAPSTSIGAAVRERSKTSSPGSSSPQSKQLTEESFSLGTKEDDSASMVEGDESQVQSSKATASATRRRAWQGQRLNIFGIQPETPGTRPVLQFMRESNRGSVSTAKSPDTPVTFAPGGSQGDSGNDGVGLVAGSSVLPSAVQGKSYASISGIPSHRESLSSSIQDVQPGGVRGAGRRTPNVRTPVSASPTTVFPFASEGLLKKTSKRQTPGLEGYTPSAKTRRETGTVLPSSLGEWQGLTLRTPMKSTSPGVSEMQPLSSLVASTSRGALQSALPGSMSPSSSARPQSLRAPSRGSSSYSE